MKSIIIFFGLLTITFAVNVGAEAAPVDQIPVFLPIAKDGNEVKYMNQYEAVEYCAGQGNHLPSARELAQLAKMSFGVRGIVDSCGWDSKCYSIKAINNDGSPDEFCYSNDGYQRPPDDLGIDLWSSSAQEDVRYGWIFENNYNWKGLISSALRYYDGRWNKRIAVRCVLGR